MIVLVTADNLIQLFIGWEGVGLSSYLLINFWFTRIQANKAAIKAMLLNRIGDFSLVLGILILFVNFKAVDYATIFSLTPFFVENKNIFPWVYVFGLVNKNYLGFLVKELRSNDHRVLIFW